MNNTQKLIREQKSRELLKLHSDIEQSLNDLQDLFDRLNVIVGGDDAALREQNIMCDFSDALNMTEKTADRIYTYATDLNQTEC